MPLNQKQKEAVENLDGPMLVLAGAGSGKTSVVAKMIAEIIKINYPDTEIITADCNRTISAIHQPSFEYTDSILKNWKNSNIKTIKDIAALDESFEKNKSFRVKE